MRPRVDPSDCIAAAVTAVGSIGDPNNQGGSVTTSPTAGQIYPNASLSADPLANAGVFTRLNTVVTDLTAPTLPSLGSPPTGSASLTCSSSSPTLTVAAGHYASITANSGCTIITFSGGAATYNLAAGTTQGALHGHLLTRYS